MYWLKSCRKCREDLYENKDSFGTFISCLQCSSYLTESEEAELLGQSGEEVGLSKAYAILGNLAA
ncbi:MAG: hypothetical protein BZY81_08640 [SAR202 cluster bacterium Io17-Chloro-G4]|nr:MAG: hypothetical protein BZY81_08640 [SAR202 cluster bacterium Io17-Chloro-G4]